MEKIASFTIDHEKLLRGIYVSRVDTTPHGDKLTTFDIRLTEPNRQEAVSPRALHTIEHLAATYLRNREDSKNRIVYWGPMGCCTGNYLIVQGTPSSEEMVSLILDTFRFIADFEGEIPGASPRDCGNYLFNDLDEAKRVAKTFCEEVLKKIKPENLSYPA